MKLSAQLFRRLRAVMPWRARVRDIRPAVRKALAVGGLDAAVRLLNGRVAHRYTAVFRLVIDQVASLAIHDVEGGAVPARQVTIDRGHSFCQYAIADGVFLTENSADDPRLDGHVAQGKIAAYHGVALIDDSGQAFGSLCHFDPHIRFLSSKEFDEMKAAALEIARYLSLQNTAASAARDLAA